MPSQSPQDAKDLKEEIVANQKLIDGLNERLERKTSEFKIIQVISSEINATLDLDRILATVMQTLGNMFGFEHSLVLLKEPEADVLRVHASYGYGESAGLGAEVPFGRGVIGVVAKHRKLMRAAGVTHQLRYMRKVATEFERQEENPLPGLPDVKSQLAIPLVVKDELIGVYAVESDQNRAYDALDETILGIVGNQIGAAIANARAYRQVEDLSENLERRVEERTAELAAERELADRARQETEKLAQFSRRMNESTDLEEITRDVFGYLQQEYGLSRTGLFVVDEAQGEFRFVAWRDQEHAAQAERLAAEFRAPVAPSAGALYRTYTKQKNLVFNRLPADRSRIGNPTDRQIVTILDMKGLLHVPLVVQGRTIGILGAEPGRHLTDQDITSINRFCHQIAGAVYGSRLLHDLAEQQARTEAAKEETEKLAEFARRINETTDLNRILDEVFDYLGKAYGAQDIVMQVVDVAANELRTVRCTTDRPQDEIDFAMGLRVPLKESSGTLYRSYKKRKPFYTHRTTNFPTEMDRMIATTLRLGSVAHFPLVIQEETIGILWISFGKERRTRAQIASIARFCDQVAGAVSTSHMVQRVSEERSRAEQARKETQVLADLARRANQSKDLDHVLEAVLQTLAAQFGADRLALFAVEGPATAGTPELVLRSYFRHGKVVAPTDYPELLRHHPLDEHAGVLFRTYRKQKALNVDRFDPARLGDSHFDRAIYEAWHFSWFAHIPLMVNDEVIGILAFTGEGENRLSRKSMAFLDQVGAQVAGAVRAMSLLEEAETARNESDRLLANILPTKVARELKEHGAVEPLFYDSVSVLFTDFVGFTAATERMMPDELIQELDGCLSQFDAVVARNRMEKLKTIGDAYMCAGGLPAMNQTHAIDACLTALEFRAFMAQMAEVKMALGHDFWRIRIGVHSGPVTTGVIGQNKFQYDIWGDTVNTASRMESSGEPDRINISVDTHALVKDFFECSYRGKIAAKGKGDLDMYFLQRIRPELSADEDGMMPNARFELQLAEVVDSFQY